MLCQELGSSPEGASPQIVAEGLLYQTHCQLHVSALRQTKRHKSSVPLACCLLHLT
jgi:hypothetical protein